MIGFLVSSVFWQQTAYLDPQYQYQRENYSPVIQKGFQFTHYKPGNPNISSPNPKPKAQALGNPIRGFVRPQTVPVRVVPQKKEVVSVLPEQKLTLVIAPHPDDAILCCGKTIQSRIHMGHQVKVIYLTNGDALANETIYDAREYATTRQQEAQKAMSMIGVNRQNLAFLGFPDAKLSQLSNYKLKSPYTVKRRTKNGLSRLLGLGHVV